MRLKLRDIAFMEKGSWKKPKKYTYVYIYAKIIGKIAQGIKRLEWYLYNIYYHLVTSYNLPSHGVLENFRFIDDFSARNF